MKTRDRLTRYGSSLREPRGWDAAKGKTKEGWRDVREATRGAWYRVRGH
jgi:hypothetical protein